MLLLIFVGGHRIDQSYSHNEGMLPEEAEEVPKKCPAYLERAPYFVTDSDNLALSLLFRNYE